MSSLRPMDNPPNPYESSHAEWLGEPPTAERELFEDASRSILARNDSPDIDFRWSVNPYRGCQHACAYCYARPTHEYLGFGAGTDFDTRLVVKRAAPELLEQEFRKRRWQGELVAFSGVTDCYQPIEASFGLTRRCLEVCLRYRNPVAVITKSYLVVRDADLLAELARVSAARVYLSIPFVDVKLSRALEPGAPRPAQRFAALRKLRQAGVPVGVMVAPVIPGLNEQEIPAILERAAEAGADRASLQALRLPGSVETVFRQRLREAVPLRAGRIEQRILDMRAGRFNETRFGERMRGQGPYWRMITDLFELHARRLGLCHSWEDQEIRAPRPTLPQQGLLPFATEEAGSS